MIIAGLDVASSTGVAWIDPGAHPSTWRALALQAEGEDTWSKVGDFSAALRELLAETRPDFAVIERPLNVVVEYESKQQAVPHNGRRMINATTTITLAGLAGAAIATLEALGLPWATIPSATWRASYFGKGYKPRENWKKAACDLARMQGVKLPSTQKAAEDAAESVGIAHSWTRSTPAPQHRQAFIDLRTGRQPALELI